MFNWWRGIFNGYTFEGRGIVQKTLIYATDLNNGVLETAENGIFEIKKMEEYTYNYIKSGGLFSFSKYYISDSENAIFNNDLKKNIVWAQHNLVTDSSFNEFDVIFCRNVMIYFNKELQDWVHNLLYESLIVSGYLGLGSKESKIFSTNAQSYEEVEPHIKLYKKIK